MELSLGRHADYAIRATFDLARHHGDGRRKCREISEATAVPASYLPQILAQLVRGGIATSTAGPRGGYGLARAPDRIDVFEVVTAVGGDVYDSVCVLRGGTCDAASACAIHLPWVRAQHALTEELAATTLDQVVELGELLHRGHLSFGPDLAPERDPDLAPELDPELDPELPTETAPHPAEAFVPPGEGHATSR